MRIVGEVWAQLRSAVTEAIRSAAAAGELSGVLPDAMRFEMPKQKGHGDFATNVAMLMARAERKPPRAVAEALVRHLPSAGTWIDRAEVAGPGFINFFLRREWVLRVLPAVQAEREGFGRSNYGEGRRILLEYVSANPTGPMVLVQARSAAYGSTLARVLDGAGYRCDTEFYVNDAGNQVRSLARSADLRVRQQAGEAVEFTGEYPGDYVNEAARALLQTNPDFTQQPEADRVAFLERWAVEYFRSGQEEILRRYGVEFSNWFSERRLRETGAVAALIGRLQAAGAAYEADGAVWMKTSEYGDDKDRVLVKSSEEYTYFAADAAYHLDKYERGYDILINILGQDHHGYQGRMKAMVQCLGRPAASLELLFTQLVRLIRGGEIVRMSKRRGEFVLMEDLLDEVSVDAARFFFLTRSPDTHMDFDLDLANLASSDNPVYYAQYAHARIASLLREATERGLVVPAADSADLGLLDDESETDLLGMLAWFPEEIIEAADAREPHRLTRYATDLATAFHTFYTRCRVLGAESRELTLARLVLVDAVRTVLANALSLLGVSAPERM